MATVGRDLLDVPFPEMIQKLGLSIAEAQYALDEVGIRLTQIMAGEDVEIPDPDNPDETMEISGTRVKFGGEQLSMMELGFTPTFYQFVDSIIEVKISISMTTETERETSRRSFAASGGFAGIPGIGGGAKMKASSVSASYAAKYQYTAEGSSLLRTKLVTVPTPSVLEERIRALVESD